MATTEIPQQDAPLQDYLATRSETAAGAPVRAVLAILSSLRLTVALFAALLFLVFAGTLAQVDHGIWYVVDVAYFRVWFAFIEWQAFERLVQMFHRSAEWNLSGGFYFPGGWLIGTALAVNLLAAHAVRFRVAAKGTRLAAGLAVIAVGALATFLVIRSGMDSALESELSPEFFDWLWRLLRAGLAGLTLAGGYCLVLSYHQRRSFEWWLLAGVEAVLAVLVAWLLYSNARLDDSGLRILWQLIKGGGAGLVLLVGCVMVFRKRAGIVLLHGGVALMMLSELLTGVTANEANMTIYEGQTANYAYSTRHVELALVDRSGEGEDQVTVVPQWMLRQAAGKENGTISNERLPCDIQVLEFYENSRLREPQPGEVNLANAGAGKYCVAEQLRKVRGLGDEDQVNMPSAYVRLVDKSSGESLGTYLVSTAPYAVASAGAEPRGMYMPDQPVAVDGRTFDLSLRFERDYKPHSLTLKEFRFDRYLGTSKAKNYSSLVQLRDPDRNIDREVRIWMNNPLRYAGETYYQSSFDAETEQATVLQVVSNPGWMIPYVACMLVATGMLAHFGIALQRFTRRRAERASLAASQPGREESANDSFAARWFPVLIVLVFAGYVAGKARVPDVPQREAQIYEFGQLPLAYEGRIKPYDTLARNTLQYLSGRQEVVVESDSGSSSAGAKHKKSKLPAIRWLLDVISGAEAADEHRVFRIDNLELLDALGLPRREGFRYSNAELREVDEELRRQTQLASEAPAEELTLFQRRVLELNQKRTKLLIVQVAFQSPQLRADMEHLHEDLDRTRMQVAILRDSVAPRAVPPKTIEGEWTPLLEAEFTQLLNMVRGVENNPATTPLRLMLDAYAQGDSREFNTELYKFRSIVREYEEKLIESEGSPAVAGMAAAEKLRSARVRFEAFYNQFSPFYYSAVLYLVAFVLAALSWLGWSQPLARASNWLLILTFAIHTFALVARIYISGRPPVTNLYSSAVFIGWACVLLALVLESIYRLGIGNLVASVVGFLTLIVAHQLSLDGDTFVVLQAVLDTQFWLATHVVCITLGYSTTFLAGMFGAIYVLLGRVLGALGTTQRQQLARMTYGTLCFALFFSFVGTVLGGLWADDSWGRFWGWDPKENGALIIVLWNALVLHARWGAMIGQRGLALLAIFGNVVTSWSWFGVNELGVGLHAYGGFDGKTATWLLMFAASQLALIVVGALPEKWLPGDGPPKATTS